MAAIHHRSSLRQAQREVDAALAVGWTRYRALDLRLDELGAQIVRARRLAAAAGTLEPSR